jgi:glyoxylase-like metal-dependent hydrolase (beta-lactamase superfamily II)
MFRPTRRQILAGAAAFAALGPGHGSRAAQAAGAAQRFRIGEMTVTALHDGVWERPLTPDFVRNAPIDRVQAALAAAGLPTGARVSWPFTALLVQSARRTVLIDTGTGGQITPSANALLASLAAAGLGPAAIDTVLISHFHPDHINGLKTKDNARVFPGAEIKVAEAEWSFWMDDAQLRRAAAAERIWFLNARRIFADMTEAVTRFAGGEVAPGIHALAAPGHTPGHTAFVVASGSESLLVLGDAATHPALFLRHPGWQASFDRDGPQAVATRHRLLDLAVAERLLVHGYHFPFPAVGRILRAADGYAFVVSG